MQRLKPYHASAGITHFDLTCKNLRLRLSVKDASLPLGQKGDRVCQLLASHQIRAVSEGSDEREKEVFICSLERPSFSVQNRCL